MGRAAKHVAHRIISVDLLPWLGSHKRHRIGNAQLLRHAPQILPKRAFSDDSEMHIRTDLQQLGEHAHNLIEVLLPRDAPDVEQQPFILRQTTFASGIHAFLMVVTFGRKAGDIHAAGNDVNRRIHAVSAQKVERLFRRGDDAVNPIAPPLGILARNPAHRVIRYAMSQIIGIILPDGVIGMDDCAAERIGDVTPEITHHKFAVGMNDVKVDAGRFLRDIRRRDGDISVFKRNKGLAGQIVNILPLIILPSLALRRKDMDFMPSFGQFALKRQAGRRHAVDLGIKCIRKQANLHGLSPFAAGRYAGESDGFILLYHISLYRAISKKADCARLSLLI